MRDDDEVPFRRIADLDGAMRALAEVDNDECDLAEFLEMSPPLNSGDGRKFNNFKSIQRNGSNE